MGEMTPEEAYDHAVAQIALAEREGWTELDLSGQGLTELPPTIGLLTNLRVLRFSLNSLTTVPDTLGRLTQLQILDLSHNQLIVLDDWIGELVELQSLDLSYNQLSTVPNTLRKLTELRELYLRNNQLMVVPDTLGKLTRLRELTFYDNQLMAIPDTLGELSQLQVLNLGRNKLTVVPDTIGELTQLQTLNLGNNKLTTIPDSLGKLRQLQNLLLNANQLKTIPDTFSEMLQLQSLNLRENQLITVPDWLVEMPQLATLHLHRNPISQPPPEQFGEALVKYGKPVDLAALRRYYAQLWRAGRAFSYEAKLLIVGEGGAGKTSLVRKLQDIDAPLPPPEDSTDGIEIQTWGFLIPLHSRNQHLESHNQNYHVNIWDFGGQTIYHATHQFFLTKRSVYVLVADTRRQHTGFYDWLKMQETFGGDSPIILLKNRNRQHGNECVIENLPHLQSRFPNLKEIVELDLENVPHEVEWPDLLRYLEKHFLALDHIGVPHPKTWVDVRQCLNGDSRDTISHEEYLALCAEQGIDDPADALQLSDYLHHLGDILHFQDDPILTDLVILKPTWGLDAVYRVLDNKEIAAANGQFILAQLRDLWHEARYHHHRDKLLRLMQKFQLCYRLRDSEDTFIAPQLLGTETPDYKWNSTADDLQLRYKYPIFMPRGILSRAIVALHHRIEDQRLVWRTGVILRDQYARAELLELRGEGEIRIRVSGRNKRDLLMEIVRALDDLHRGFPKLQYEKLVPCNCETCAASSSPHFFRLGKLLERLQHRRETVECDNPPYAEVQIRSLIDDAILQSEVQRGNIFVGGDYINVGDITDATGIGIGRAARADVEGKKSDY